MYVRQFQKSKPYQKKTVKKEVVNQAGQMNKSYFPPESTIRRIEQEAVVLLGGGYAILLQLAHPFIAAGIDDYSNFQSDILNRLYRTVLFLHRLVFEDRLTAEHALTHFHNMHAKIQGTLDHRCGNFPPNTVYSGIDPEAKLWVFATFVDTSLKTYERFIKPLNPKEHKDYYSDCLLLARLLEIPNQLVPQTLEEFNFYLEKMINSEILAVTDTARNLAKSVLYPQVGFLPKISAALLRFVTAGLLPERFRQAFGLKWNSKHEHIFKKAGSTIRFLRPIVPAWIWQTPIYRRNLTGFLLWGMQTKSARF